MKWWWSSSHIHTHASDVQMANSTEEVSLKFMQAVLISLSHTHTHAHADGRWRWGTLIWMSGLCLLCMHSHKACCNILTRTVSDSSCSVTSNLKSNTLWSRFLHQLSFQGNFLHLYIVWSKQSNGNTRAAFILCLPLVLCQGESWRHETLSMASLSN